MILIYIFELIVCFEERLNILTKLIFEPFN